MAEESFNDRMIRKISNIPIIKSAFRAFVERLENWYEDKFWESDPSREEIEIAMSKDFKQWIKNVCRKDDN